MKDKTENKKPQNESNIEAETVRYIPKEDADRIVSELLTTHKGLLEKLAKDE